ncbi:MAG: hypothetical protein RI563_00065 [Thiohalophilus sp.]|uniref:hypothetical protein n=1 Tax=Thiohalophilus sp. TaxID=3028392 RepID=UPI00286FDC7B|nr:hypothetical protein [Thiohalophilus sp.]MDR9435240.1 hypothetical protein [Thiohalophilus sp.]
MQQETTAWLLNLGQSLYAAIGENDLVHVIDYSEISDLPALLANTENSVHWQGKELNVINLAKYLSDRTLTMLSSEPIIGVVAYQSDNYDRPQYGGVLMAGIPAKKIVNNSQACELPEPVQKWRDVAISCYSDEGRPVPVLDLPTVFSTGLS